MLHGDFGKYQIEEVIGVGGMSVVYRAVDTALNRTVAIKILNMQQAVDAQEARRFQREAQIVQKLRHPHIINLYEYGEIEDQPYLVMEYMPGGSLAQHFLKPVSVTLGESAGWLKAIASALDYAHANGVIHRDLKLENILIDEQGQLMLSDFGIARMIDATRLTESGQIFGTPLYMSPEQVRGVKDVDFRADIYSLSVIAYLLATGYFPFSGISSLAILNQHLGGTAPLPSNLNPRLPSQTDWVLYKGLSKLPQDRFASAGALAQAFEATVSSASAADIVILTAQPTPILAPGSIFSEGRRIGSDTERNGKVVSPAPQSPPPRRRLVFTGCLGGLVVFVLLGILLLMQNNPLFTPKIADVTATATAEAELTQSQTATITT